MSVELRYGKFGAYFYDGVKDISLHEVLIRLGNEEHLRGQIDDVLMAMDDLPVYVKDSAVLTGVYQKLKDALNFQAEIATTKPASHGAASWIR